MSGTKWAQISAAKTEAKISNNINLEFTIRSKEPP